MYGLILLSISLLMMRRYGRYSKGISDIMFILLCCSISTIIFGVLTGSYFGDFLAKYVLGSQPSDMPFAAIDPLAGANTIKLFAVVLVVGVMHTVFGNVLGVFDKFRQRQFKAAIKENISSLLFLLGLGVAYFGEVNLGLALSAVGFILFVWNMGFMAIMQVPGILSNIVSYVRLLALNLTTPGLAMAFNLLASIAWGIPVVGPIVAGVVFIASHSMIIFLSSIGPFVHSLRLHFVEFYSTFYSGGGAEFIPFAEARRYTIRR
ncbi:MAG: V-type ATPase 116kDa subunit family protein, partial [Candidatus Altiarchaeota archaeon]